MTTDKNNTAPDPQPAERANASVVEQIAQQWDGCQYDAPSEMVDIGAAIRRAGKRLSAELAEQQRELIVLALSDAYSAGAEGLQFGGLARLEALASALAATGKQQVGEVQGDARRILAKHMRRIAAAHNVPRLGTEADIVEGGEEYDFWMDAAHAAVSEALAARQPGVQDWRHIANEWADATANGVQWLRNIRDGVCTAADALAIMESNVERIQQMKPPAQGIDLGQQQDAARWRWVREQNGVTVSVEEADDDGDMTFVSGHTPEELDAAIDGQRDAAPGVGNG